MLCIAKVVLKYVLKFVSSGSLRLIILSEFGFQFGWIPISIYVTRLAQQFYMFEVSQ